MPKTKVVFLGPPEGILRWKPLFDTVPPDIEVVTVDSALTDSQKISLCKDADAIITAHRTTSVNMLKACPKVKLIQTLGASYEWVDVKGIGELGISVATCGGANAIPTAEQTIALMLATSKQFVRHWLSAKNGYWKGGEADKRQMEEFGEVRENIAWEEGHYELSEKTVGIVGLGYIGKQVAKRLKGFDCNVIYYARGKMPVSALELRELNVRLVPFEELLRTSDLVTLHVPLNSITRHMIGRRELAMMKPSAILINTSRGLLVDERALYEALTTGKIRGAGLDVVEVEPMPKENPLLSLDNVIITPHMGATSMERVVRSARFAFENIRRVMEGKAPESLARPG